MLPQTKQLLITTSIIAVITTVITLWNSSATTTDQQQIGKTARLIKVFVLSFILVGVVLYIMQDNDQNTMMTNIIKGDPDF